MKFKRGHSGGLFVTYRDEIDAERWAWLWNSILRRPWACADGYFNAFEIIPNRPSLPKV